MARQSPKLSTATRRKHTNSKLGCLNCKRKKIRCDETLPQCGKCARGKREVCSYLSLTASEIQRIRLTHSLRTSQNKLLNHDYRLPTSSGEGSSSASSSGPLEFVHELLTLPPPPSRFGYSHLRFSNLVGKDIENGLEEVVASAPAPVPQPVSSVVHQQRLVNFTPPVSPAQPLFQCYPQTYPPLPLQHAPLQAHRILPGGYYQPTSFTRISYKPIEEFNHYHRIQPDLTYLGVGGKQSIVEYSQQWLHKSTSEPGVDITCGAFIYVGVLTMSVVARNKMAYSMSFPGNINYHTLYHCLMHWKKRLYYEIMVQFNRHCQAIPQLWKQSAGPSISRPLTQSLAHVVILLSGSVMLIEDYLDIQEKWAELFRNVTNFTSQSDEERLSSTNRYPMLQFLLANMNTNISEIRIPSYPPDFLEELADNLRKLEFIYLEPLAIIGKHFSEHHQMQFAELSYQYRCLISFLTADVMPAVFPKYLKQRPDEISMYRIRDVWRLHKRWHEIYPGKIATFNPSPKNHWTDEDRFLADISATLYAYYVAASAALEAVFPVTRPLFITQFLEPMSGYFTSKEIMMPSANNYYNSNHFHHDVCDLLQKSNFYAMRLYTFFRRRYQAYHKHITWREPFPQEVKNNRFRSRVITNSCEIPIYRFNHTLIRPTHYPTKVKEMDVSENEAFLTRTDESVDKKIYSRNIERLNFFEANNNLQFDYKTMMLLSDYRIDETDYDIANNTSKLSLADLEEFYHDRVQLLRIGLNSD